LLAFFVWQFEIFTGTFVTAEASAGISIQSAFLVDIQNFLPDRIRRVG
jgi:hypothetical protein